MSVLKVLKIFLKNIAPPFLSNMYRRYTVRPVFNGVYERYEAVPNDNPWHSEHWISLARQKLEDTRQTAKGFPSEIESPYDLVCFAVNQLTQKSFCRVLDFGGGTGFVYFYIKANNGFLFHHNLEWHVVESERFLTAMGEKQKGAADNILFHDHLPVPEGKRFEIIFANTVMQYVEDYKDALTKLLAYKPACFIFTRLLAGDNPCFITSQNIFGRITPCIFWNAKEIIEYLLTYGYTLELHTACLLEELNPLYGKTILPGYRIPYACTLIFFKK